MSATTTEEAQPTTEPEPDIQPPAVNDARLGVLGAFWSYYNWRRKMRKKASKGYVMWYLVDDGFPEAKFVKPTLQGGGVPEYEYKNERYLFPFDARMPHKRNGMWVVVHKRGEADPIDVRSPREYALSADELEEYRQMTPQTSPPGLLDRLDMDAQEAFKWGIMAIIGFAIVYSVVGGGL